MTIITRPATREDAAAIAGIYNYYVANTCVTFETTPVTPGDMAHRMVEASAAKLPWLVAVESPEVIGFAYASKWKGRCAYRFAVESTIYLDSQHTGKGVGRQLYEALLEAIRELSMHAVIGGIALPNDASIRLHEALGFRKVGHFEEVGFKQDRWVDVGYWQRLL